jgi:hypothetical protein
VDTSRETFPTADRHFGATPASSIGLLGRLLQARAQDARKMPHNLSGVLPACSAGILANAQTQRRVFSRIMTGEPYTLECYLPQITNGPNFPTWSPTASRSPSL